MGLKEEIDRFIQKFTKNVPEETRKIMQEEAEHLAKSGIIEKSLKVGDKAPTFSLPNIQGKVISSPDLLAQGPLVVSFYRGGW